MVPEGGLESAQGCPYWILSRTNRLTIHTYQAITRRIKGLFPLVFPRCAPYVPLVWAQYGHNREYESPEPV